MAFYTSIDATKKQRLLTEKTHVDGSKYVYCKGVSSLAAGDFVRFDRSGATTRALDSAITSGAIAVAMAAVTTSTNYGWFLVDGYYASGNVATHSGGAGLALFLSSSAGRATTTPATEKTIYGAFSAGDSASNVGPVFLRRGPVAPGDIST